MLTAHSLVFWACQAILLISVATRIVVGLEIESTSQTDVAATPVVTPPADIKTAAVGTPVPGPLQCILSWSTYLFEELKAASLNARKEDLFVTKAETRIYETIQSFGAGTTYMAPDDIVHFRFSSSPDSSATSTVFVTRTYTALDRSFLPVGERQWKNMTGLIEPPCQPDCQFLWSLHLAGNLEAGIAAPPTSRCPFKPINVCDLVSGSEIALLYWPPNRRGNNSIFSTKAITFRGQDLILRGSIIDGKTMFESNDRVMPSVMTGDWTFTSPSVYVAYHQVTALVYRHTVADQSVLYMSKVIAPSGVLTMRPNDVSSIVPYHREQPAINGYNYAQLVARGEYNPVLNEFINYASQGTTVLNYQNLADPVPASNYYDARSNDCWGKQTHCGTITDDSYRPQLRIAQDILAPTMIGNGTGGIPALVFRFEKIVDPAIVIDPLGEPAGPRVPILSNRPAAAATPTLAGAVGSQMTPALQPADAQNSGPKTPGDSRPEYELIAMPGSPIILARPPRTSVLGSEETGGVGNGDTSYIGPSNPGGKDPHKTAGVYKNEAADLPSGFLPWRCLWVLVALICGLILA